LTFGALQAWFLSPKKPYGIRVSNLTKLKLRGCELAKIGVDLKKIFVDDEKTNPLKFTGAKIIKNQN